MKPTILIVDDIPANILSLRVMLEDLHVEIDEASSGNEALQKIIRRPYFVILLDVQMPEMNGYEVAKLIHSNKKTAHIPIIFVTAMGKNIENELQAYSSGAIDYISKPINPSILLSKLRIHLELADKTQKLEESNEKLAQFAAMVCHDGKKPLNALLGYKDLIAEELGENPPGNTSKYLQKIDDVIFRMAKFYDDLFEFSRPRENKLSKVPVNVHALVETIRINLKEAIDNSKAQISYSGPDVIQTGPTELGLILQNLIANSIKYVSPGTTPLIKINGAIDTAGDFNLSIQDNGIGFDNSYAEKIFEPFTRLHTGGSYQGTGLGLSVVKKLSEYLGGKIKATSQVGVGSIFTLTLPQ